MGDMRKAEENEEKAHRKIGSEKKSNVRYRLFFVYFTNLIDLSNYILYIKK